MKKDFENIKSTKPNRQLLDESGRKCIDENLEEDLVHWIYENRSKMLHAQVFLTNKTTILPSKIYLLLVVDGVKSLCEGMGSLLEEKLQLPQKDPLRMVDCILAYVRHIYEIQNQFNFHHVDIITMGKTSIWNDMVSNATVEKISSKKVP